METTSISELTALWGRVLKRLEDALDKQVYETFFKDSYIHSIDGKTINVVVNSKLAAQIIPANYWQQVGDALADCSQTDYSVRYVTKDDVAAGTQITPAKPAFFSDSYIKPEYTFDNFVVGESNRDAYQASLIISQNPGKLYNPVLIYGNSGLGKTHLLHAIGNTIKLKFPKYRVLYVHAQDFLNEYVKFVSGDKEGISLVDWFRDSVDVLLVDDVQFLANKKSTEETFFSIYNSFYTHSKQVVITCDQHPSKLNGLDERLKSRFIQGLPLSIEQPEEETCEKILKMRIEANGLNVDDFDPEVITFLAKTFRKNVRELEGALDRLLFFAVQRAHTERITIEIAKSAVMPLLDVKESLGTLTAERIIDTVAEYYNLPSYQITGKIRTSQIALARHIAMYLIRVKLDLPFGRIGAIFGGKDHATVINGVNKVENSLKADKGLQKAISDLDKRLK